MLLMILAILFLLETISNFKLYFKTTLLTHVTLDCDTRKTKTIVKAVGV